MYAFFAQQRQRLRGAQVFEQQAALAYICELSQVGQQNGPVNGHLCGASSGASRSRIASATSCFDWSGKASAPPARERMVTRFVSTSKPEPGSVAAFSTIRSSDLSTSFFCALAR